MIRYLPIILGACIAAVSGLILAVGVRELAKHESLSVPPVKLSIEEFVHARPDNVNKFRLTNIRHGASVYPEPVKKDGQWEKVYVCLFSNDTWRLPKNYISVIVEIQGVSGRKELAELLATKEIDVSYWPDEQYLPSSVYNRMAFKYRGMRFSECIHCQSGGPPPSPEYGNHCVAVGLCGLALSFIGVIGYYLIKLLVSMLRREKDPWYDDDENEVRNKAGLPSIPVSKPSVTGSVLDSFEKESVVECS